MKRLLIVCAVLSIICITANISNSAEYWAKTYGGNDSDTANLVQQTSDDGYIVAGGTHSFGAGDIDIWLLKLDSSGAVLWQKTYGGSSLDVPFSLQQTSDNGYIVAGYTYSFGAGFDDGWLLKLDNSGNVQWQKTFGGTDEDDLTSVQQTNDNGYIIAGWTYSFGARYSDFWLLKLDNSGTLQWQKTYGGISSEYAYSVQQTSDNGYIVAGSTSSFGAGSHDGWVLKLDSSGNVQWQKTYGGTDADDLISVQQTSDNGYIIAGQTNSFGAGDYDAWLLKLDNSGTLQWQKTYGGTDADHTYSVQQTSDDGYIVAGWTYSYSSGESDYDPWLLKLDSSGNVQWQKTYADTSDAGIFYSVQQTSDNEYIIAGEIFTSGAGQNDFWFLKLDSSGNIPDCDIVDIRDVLVTETYTIGQPTEATITEPSISPSITNTTPVNTSAETFDVCDTDDDGIFNLADSCPADYNPLQEDTFPPQGNGIGDACDCECDFDCSGGVDAIDVTAFLGDFGRGVYNAPCSLFNQCNGDFDCDRDVDADNVTKFLEDFGRNQFNNPCPQCEVAEWCRYSQVQYLTDFLEPGNIGGWTSSLKTFDEEWTISAGEEIEVDIWLHDVPEPLQAASFKIFYDPSVISIVGVNAYDDLNLPGPWDSSVTATIPEPDGPGSYMFFCATLFPAIAPDGGSDIIMARFRFHCATESEGVTSIEVTSTGGVTGCIHGESGNRYHPDFQIITINVI